MASWSDVEKAEPAFASKVRSLFDAGRHKTLATLRADGSPRISGIECTFDDGALCFGSMVGSRKLADLLRDPRFALHGPTFHPEEGRESEWPGEAKISGRAVRAAALVEGPEAESDGVMFIGDIDEVVVTSLTDDGTKLAVEWWTPESGFSRIERS